MQINGCVIDTMSSYEHVKMIHSCLSQDLLQLASSYFGDRRIAMSSAPLTLYDVMDVPELWVALGAEPPGVKGHLRWRARCLLVSHRVYRPRVYMLRRLRAQEEMDNPSDSSEFVIVDVVGYNGLNYASAPDWWERYDSDDTAALFLKMVQRWQPIDDPDENECD